MGQQERDISKYNYELRRRFYETISGKFLIVSSFMLDAFIVISAFMLIAYGLVVFNLFNSLSELFVILLLVAVALSIFYIAKKLFQNRTFGQVILGLRTVEIGSMRPINRAMEKRLNVGAWEVGFYHDSYRLFYFLSSDKNQTMLMNRLGHLLVIDKKYQNFVEHYLDGGQLVEELNINPELIVTTTQRIFKDWGDCMDRNKLIKRIKDAQPCYRKILLARFIDFCILAVILLIPIIFFWINDTLLIGFDSYLWISGFAIFDLIFVFAISVILTNGQTFGEKVTNVYLYNLYSMNLVSRERVVDMLSAGLAVGMKTTDAYQTIHDILNPMQTLTMKRLGYIYMDIEAFNNLIEDVPNYQKILYPDFGKTIEEINEEIEEYYRNQ